MSARIIEFPIRERTPNSTERGKRLDKLVAMLCESLGSDPEFIRRSFLEALEKVRSLPKKRWPKKLIKTEAEMIDFMKKQARKNGRTAEQGIADGVALWAELQKLSHRSE